MENTATSSVEHTPWIAEVMMHGKDAGMYQVVNSKGWVIAACMVKEEAEFFALAPELLTELKSLHERVRMSDITTEEEDERIDALIAKATGTEP